MKRIASLSETIGKGATLLLICLFAMPSFAQDCSDGPLASFTIDTVNYSSFTRIFTDASTTSNSITNYAWDFGDGETLTGDDAEVSHHYNAEGSYAVSLTVTDENNCTDDTTLQVSIQENLVVPNVFTPNGDNVNDFFVVKTNGISLYSIIVYSRWGKEVFKRENVEQLVWDGTLPNGKKVNTGTYYYIISVNDTDIASDPITGFVSIFY